MAYLLPDNTGNDTFIPVATGHFITNFKLTLFGQIHFGQLNNTSRQFITNG
jgi:hypothetical protein